MPWRRLGSVSTSMPLNLTPRWVSTWTTAAEKPHCGNTGVPFMNSTTSLLEISCLMRSNTGLLGVARLLMARVLRPMGSAVLRYGGLQGERVELVAHLAAQRL